MSAIPVIREPLPRRLRHPAQPSGTRLGPFDGVESTGRHRSQPRAAISGASRQHTTPDGPRTEVGGSGVGPASMVLHRRPDSVLDMRTGRPAGAPRPFVVL